MGHYNYYVLTRELYHQVKEDIPDYVGVYVEGSCVKRPKKQDIDNKTLTIRKTINGKSTEVVMSWKEMLKDSFIRSLCRDSQKLYNSNNKGYIEHMTRKIDRLTTDKDTYKRMFYHLYDNVSILLGSKMTGILSNEDNNLFLSMCSEHPYNRRIKASNSEQLATLIFNSQDGLLRFSIDEIDKMLNPAKEGEFNE